MYSKRFLSILLLAVMLLSPLAPAGALSGAVDGAVRGTSVGENVTSDTTWSPSGSPYLVEGNLTISSGATLRILAGVEVRCGNNATITVLGRLIVEGEEGENVVFRVNGTGQWGGIRIGGGGWMNYTVIRDTREGLTVYNNATFWLRYSSITHFTRQQISCVENSTLYLLATPLNTDSVNITGRVYERNPITIRVLKDVDMSPFEGAMVRMWGDGRLFFASEGWGGGGPKTNSSGVISNVVAPYRNHEGRVNISAVSIRVQAFAMDVNHTWTAQRSGIIADQKKEIVLLFDFTPPPVPTNFTARATGGNTIKLFWTLNDPDAVQVQIFMNSSSGPHDFTIVGRASPSEGHYTVVNLAEETTYYFVLRASDLVPNYSPMTPVVSATTLDITPPLPPENLTAKRGATYLMVAWDPSPSPDVTGYSIYLNTTSNLLENLTSEVRHYNVTGLSPDTEYTVLIIAWDDATPSPLPSRPAVLKVSTLDTIPPPAPEFNYTFLGEVFLPESGYVNLSGVLLKGRVRGEEWALVSVYLNGVEVLNATAHRENFTVFVNFVPGENRIYLRAMDPAGNLGPRSREITFIYDPFPPLIDVVGIPENPTSPFNLNALVNVTDPSPIYSISWHLRGPGVNRSGDEREIGVEGLGEGTYTITVSARDIAGNLNTTVIHFSVVPPDTTPPRLISSTVKDGDEDVPPGANLTLYFNEPVRIGRVELLRLPEGDAVDVRALVHGRNVTITPVHPMEKGRLYRLIVKGVEDLSGNRAPDILINFTTEYPESDDYDSDGLPNTYEEMYDFLDPFNPSDATEDPDGDGLTNLQEYLNRTRPDMSDTDGDGYSDKDEVDRGTDPNDRNSYPYTAEEKKTPVLYMVAGVVLVLLLIFILLSFIRIRRSSGVLEEEGAEGSEREIIEGSLEDDFVNCPECGAPVERGAEYCPECGAVLNWE